MLKKMFLGALAGVMLFTSTALAADVNVKVNGEAVVFTNQSPVIVEGRTLIPLRGVFEKIGYTASWEPHTKTATLTDGENEVVIVTGSSEFTVNGQTMYAEVPAQIINGSLMIPLRAIAEGTGGAVNWNNETKTADITVFSEEDIAELEAYAEKLAAITEPMNALLSEMQSDYDLDMSAILEAESMEEYIANVAEQIDEEKAALFISKIEDYKAKFNDIKAQLEAIEAPAYFKEFHDATIELLDSYVRLLDAESKVVNGEITAEELEAEVNSTMELLENYFALVMSMDA